MFFKKPLETIQSIQDFTLKPEDFKHKTHLRLAWELLCENEAAKAVYKACELLKAYTSHLGVADKYHQTLTVASIRTVRHFILKSKSSDFEEFLSEFPILENNFKGLIEQHYSLERFTHESAKKEYLEPDLLPYD
ncbi:hypothetical protein [Jiulongibacter sediminis]|uniref:Uncharacterized protein n=1 Tax=Jiulongibacter sediminis TaxID=1605367 RepID=A0A0P7BQH3_9BACT|nr:hypothetical protein [Jiulongibacter sediminis]KPM49431.1 hypothetical protein AFM12_02100 [Jiulongibacter sediminis]TBX26479.1 hypothetical protein TK44_02105 [Jiulongibacter sediminis]